MHSDRDETGVEPHPLRQRPRHVALIGPGPFFRYERCQPDCVVGLDGIATVCGARACPVCGSGRRFAPFGGGEEERCDTCGHTWAHRE